MKPRIARIYSISSSRDNFTHISVIICEAKTYMEASFILCRDRSVVVEPVCSFSRQFARDSLGGEVSVTRQT
jgi:hypothetical protein